MTTDTGGTASGAEHTVDRNDRLVILASSVGTVIEWYDFYLYGSLAAIITTQFFSGVNETTGYIFALLAFAAGSGRSSPANVATMNWPARFRPAVPPI